jgi:hypothetical protein
VAFQLTKASCVAVGTFNIYIIQPAWLTAVDIFPSETPIQIETNLRRPGFKLSSQQLKTTWFVTPGKLSVETSSIGENCGRYVAEVLKRLKWTPITAVGNNVAFRAKRSEVEPFPALETTSGMAVVPDGSSEARRAFAISLTRSERTFTLNVTMSGDVIELTGNAHLSIREGLENQSTDAAVAAAELFESDVATLVDLFSEVLRVRIGNVFSPSRA